MATDWFHGEVQKYTNELQASGCMEAPTPQPTLGNDIHDIFAPNRWVTGYEQHTAQFYNRMAPALRLASLWITEDCTLPWFYHLQYAHRKIDCRDRKKIFLAPTKKEHEPSARHDARKKLRKLSRVVSFMFTPRKYSHTREGKAWGVTFPQRQEMDWFRHYSPSDWPAIDKKYFTKEYAHRDKPSISLQAPFQDFFYSGYRSMTSAQRYRSQFMFAATIVHELAHAYWMWLGRWNSNTTLQAYGPEPRWYKDEQEPELGFSWETITLGRISNPVDNELSNPLISSVVETWRHPSERKAIVDKHINTQGMRLQNMAIAGQQTYIPSMYWRGNSWFLSESEGTGLNYLVVLHGIPMKWICDWFSEAEWEKRRQAFKRTRKHSPPPLGPTFMMVYERDVSGRATLYYGMKQQQDDPYLYHLGMQTAQMGLYDDEFDEDRYWQRMGPDFSKFW